MASADIVSSTIPGLHGPPTKEDLSTSQAIYNTLPHPEEQPAVAEDLLKVLGDLFVKHGAQKFFGLHLLHGHFSAPQGTALIGVSAKGAHKSEACLTKALPVSDIATSKLRGHVFCLQEDGSFFPYEFHESESNPEGSVVDVAFFKELASFLHGNGLANLLALERLDHFHGGNKRMELMIGEDSTVVVNEMDVIGLGEKSLTTGWHFEVADDGIISCKGGTSYAGKVKGTHQVFVDSKPLPTVEAVVEALHKEGILASASKK